MKINKAKLKRVGVVGAAIALALSATLFSGCEIYDEYTSGSINSGIYVRDGSSPLTVTGQLVVYDIVDFPAEDGKYLSTLSIQYALYNQGDESVTEQLAVPSGSQPGYYDGVLPVASVTVDGVAVTAQRRHVYDNYLSVGGNYTPEGYSSYEYAEQIKSLSDEYYENGIFTRDAAVTVYNFAIADAAEGEKFYIKGVLPAIDDQTAYWTEYINRVEDGYRMTGVDDGEGVTLCVIGEPVDLSAVEWTIEKYEKDVGYVDTEVGEYKVTMTGEGYTLGEYVDGLRGDRTYISEVDWYNGVLARQVKGLRNAEFFMWNTFEVTVAPHSSAYVTVELPAMPFINDSYSPTVKVYRYDVPLTDMWAAVRGEMWLVVETDYYKGGISSTYMTETDYGFEVEENSGRYRFSLCESRSYSYLPGEAQNKAAKTLLLVIFLPMLIAVVFCYGGGILAVVLILRKKKKKEGKNT